MMTQTIFTLPKAIAPQKPVTFGKAPYDLSEVYLDSAVKKPSGDRFLGFKIDPPPDSEYHHSLYLLA